jgi:hypothetical protein
MSAETEAGIAAEMLLEERRREWRLPAHYCGKYVGTEESAELLREILAEAVPYYWAPEQCRIVERVGPSVPTQWTPLPESFETTAGFFWFARCLRVVAATRVDLRAIAWRLEPDVLWLAWYCESGLGPAPRGLMKYVLRKPLSEALHGIDALAPPEVRDNGTVPAQQQWLRFTAAAFAFLEQRILVTRRVRPARATRRRLAAPLPEDWLRVVTLRRRVQLGASAAGHDEVAWSCRWLVRGHWREQWFPSVGRHRPIFILPYEKGPEDKPLKLPGATIFAVRR